MKKSYVYTKGGDAGKTSLIGGIRVSKSEKQLEAYGTIDELNSNLGLLHSLLTNKEDRLFIFKIQHQLFSIGAYLATDFQNVKPTDKIQSVSKEEIEELELVIDTIDNKLPQLKSFIIPGGLTASSVAHVCRTVCRRAERNIVALTLDIDISDDLLAYINRLSDYLFVLSRKINIEGQENEQLWKNCWK